eukprot:gene12146-13282_t
MPKLSKRKRQLKEIYYRKNEGEGNVEAVGGAGGEEGDEEENESQEETAPPTTSRGSQSAKASASNASLANLATSTSAAASSKSTRSSQRQAAAAAAAAEKHTQQTSAQPESGKVAETDRVWVQCNTCDKWRSLPPTVNPETLPDIWTCDLNIYDSDRNNCDAPEENYYTRDDEQQHVQVRSFLRLWVKKLKVADRAETRLANQSMTRGRKRKLDVEWIRCCNPHCGKWRAVSRGIETSSLLKRLNKNKHFGEGLWYCSMNSWDETTASCAAPQEPLWNCRWNLHST